MDNLTPSTPDWNCEKHGITKAKKGETVYACPKCSAKDLAPSAEMRKLLEDMHEAFKYVAPLAGEEMANKIEAYIRTLEKEHRAMKTELERVVAPNYGLTDEQYLLILRSNSKEVLSSLTL